MKTRQPLSTKKPPEPASSHNVIDDWMNNIVPSLQPIVKYLDKLIRKEVSDLQYAIKWKKAYYGSEEHGWLIELVPYDVSVNIVFLGASSFIEPPKLGDTSRYVKIKTLDEAKSSDIKEWIIEAGKNNGWKWQ